ncbi:MAG TPA: YlmC/YmxH family sporulation protein [Clostridiales bacterium]|nr:YlmC/YmxH family sporulation protein [Clostridiales bacterium]
MVRSSELKQMEVVDVTDGKRLGMIKDLEIDLKQGKIISIVVPAPGNFFSLLLKEKVIVIPWDKIVTIGEDVILVNTEGMHISPR